MKKSLQDRIVVTIDDLIILLQDAVRAGDVRIEKSDRIVDGLLDARHATTEKPKLREPAAA